MGQYWRPEERWWADGLGQAAPGPWLPTLPSAWLRGGGWWLVTGGRGKGDMGEEGGKERLPFNTEGEGGHRWTLTHKTENKVK